MYFTVQLSSILLEVQHFVFRKEFIKISFINCFVVVISFCYFNINYTAMCMYEYMGVWSSSAHSHPEVFDLGFKLLTCLKIILSLVYFSSHGCNFLSSAVFRGVKNILEIMSGHCHLKTQKLN